MIFAEETDDADTHQEIWRSPGSMQQNEAYPKYTGRHPFAHLLLE